MLPWRWCVLSTVQFSDINSKPDCGRLRSVDLYFAAIVQVLQHILIHNISSGETPHEPTQTKIMAVFKWRFHPVMAGVCCCVEWEWLRARWGGKITSDLSPVASGPETSRDGWVWKGGGRRGHPGWQQNLSCLGASHLLPSAHWFCAGRDQISQLIKEEEVKWRNGQRQMAKYRRSVLETQLQSVTTRMLEPVRLVDKYALTPLS